MRDYSTARGLFGFLEFIGWAALAIGLLVGFLGGAGGASFGRSAGPLAAVLAAMPGLMMALVGCLIVAFVQIGRAGIDTASNTQEALAVNRAHFDFVKTQYVAAGSGATNTFAVGTPSALAPSASMGNLSMDAAPGSEAGYGTAVRDREPIVSTAVDTEPKDEIIVYRGREIRSSGGKYYIDQINFDQISHAKKYLDLQPMLK